MDEFDPQTLSQLVAARLNHDYVSPLTAINNGVELYALSEEQQNESMEIIQESLTAALAELQFNRIAFGSYGRDERIALSSIRNRIVSYLKQSNTEVIMERLDDSPLKYEAKLWMLGILCIRASFVKLEQLRLASDNRGFELTASGSGILNPDGHFRAEDHWLQTAEPTASMVQFPLLMLLADRIGYDLIRKRHEEGRMTVNFWKRP